MKKCTLIVQGVRKENFMPSTNASMTTFNEFTKSFSESPEISFISDFDEPKDNIIIDTSGISESASFNEILEIPDNSAFDFIEEMEIKKENIEYTYSSKQYDTIPLYYSGPKTWKRVTNLHCWCCSNVVVGVPFFVPLSWKRKTVKTDIADESPEIQKLNKFNCAIDNKEELVMKVHGVMCNERCTLRYINRYNDEAITDKWVSIKLLEIVTAQLYGMQSIGDIIEAPDKSIMAQYCGPNGINVSEFRELNNQNRYSRLIKD